MMQRIKLSNAFVKLTAVHQPIRLCSTAYYQQPIESHQNSKAKESIAVRLSGKVSSVPRETAKGYLTFQLEVKKDNSSTKIPTLITNPMILNMFKGKIFSGKRVYGNGRLIYEELVDENQKSVATGTFTPGTLFHCDTTKDNNINYDVNDVSLNGKVQKKFKETDKGVLLLVQTMVKELGLNRLHQVWISKESNSFPIAKLIEENDVVKVNGHISSKPAFIDNSVQFKMRLFIHANNILPISRTDELHVLEDGI